MIEPRLFLCSGATQRGGEAKGRKVITLAASGKNPNVTIRVGDLARIFMGSVSPRMLDLMEIAAYVYTADSGTSRGTGWIDDATEQWSRDLRFVIPVRDLSFWQRADVQDSLSRTLRFLSNDSYSLRFTALKATSIEQQYLDFGNTDWAFNDIPDILMFSGGLDSLAGAVETANVKSAPLVLVSHRSVGQISARQQKLYRELQAGFKKVPMLHVPVWINKENKHGHEPTQRTRSFLFTAIGLCVGSLTSAKRVLFFENGVVSLNLPVADEVLRARASRTTHPLSLTLLTEFASLVMDRQLLVVNPYVTKTKAEIVATIESCGVGPLIGQSVSCAHTMFMTKGQHHCGTCSQCIDRRIAIIAAGCAEHEDITDYVSDVFTGSRKSGVEQAMAIHYARHATELRGMSAPDFNARFNLDLTRAVRRESDPSKMIGEFYALHQRHAAGVHSVLSAQIAASASLLAEGKIEPTSMLGLIARSRHKEELWTSYAEKLTQLLQDGVPAACRTHKPKNEPHLQEMAEGILKGHDPDLEREFPFMRWSSSATKPDFSKQSLSLWVELKYVRKKTDIRTITEDIAADITKYGDSGVRVLFVVYDPGGLIPSRPMFAKQIVTRANMRVSFI
jgi:hypothetical protein